MTWLPRRAEGETPFEQVFGLRPELLERFKDLYFALWHPPKVDPVLLELCRLHVAGLHGCASEQGTRYAPAREAGLSEEKVAALPGWRAAATFSPAERACLAFAEKFALAVQMVDDQDTEELRRHLSSAEIVALCQALALFDGFTRLRLVLAVGGAGGTVDPGRRRTLF